ncbi:gram-negative porin family protein [Paraburkholderia fungorum]|uniref:Gram-negative porin family protein n=1 Tax=Paraburkholderia fungorum TaxID=134537 RepID=A0AAU8TJP7_9BURK|nr:porin [Paraburkholderia fungorum]AJZ60966.1 gram-negative porin family protein [Paraburkholderia fungorum]
MKIRYANISVALAFAGSVAHAQSSVTLYGIVDVGPIYVSNEKGQRLIGVASGDQQGNRFGFKGRENLGGGTAAIFVLENGFNANTGALGQGGRLFGRQAYVGLSNGRYGKLTLGRQYDTNYDYMADTGAAKLFAGNGAHVSDNDNLFGSVRFQNALKYTSPDFGGFSFATMYSASDMAGGFSDNRAFSATVGYVHGMLKLAAGYLKMDRPNSADNSNGATTDFPSLFKTSAVGSQTAPIDKQQIYALTATYAFGPTSENLVYSHTNYKYFDGSHLRLDNAEANGTWHITPAVSLGLGYIFTAGHYDVINRSPRWHQIDIGLDYSLSKRSDIYAFLIGQRAVGSSNNAAIFNVPTSSSKTQAEAEFGVRHFF